MDPRIRILIDGVRTTHTSLLWFPKEVFPHTEPACSGCSLKIGTVVLLKDCPALQAAKELEDEYNESS